MWHDVIVVGGGHAGLEAAMAAARMGARTLLVTQKISTIGVLSCNPAFGGPAKGGLVREVDALGGFCGEMADLTARQCRILGETKGPATRATRVLVDRSAYNAGAQERALDYRGLAVFEGEAAEIVAEKGRAAGLKLADGKILKAGAVVLAGGTFWHGCLYQGRASKPGGRRGEAPADKLSDSLGRLGHKVGRLSTCTSPRILSKTIDVSQLIEQPGDPAARPFSVLHRASKNEACCWLTWTTPEAHRLVADGLKDSIFYFGAATGHAPRYCPSIEDKVHHFPQRERHQVFLEPDDEGIIFPSGIPTGLAPDVQAAMLRTMPGLEKAELAWPGYAIEYDFLDPRDLNKSLESLLLPGLFLAGQINGTSGYEEAAAQGLLAGANAALKAAGNNLFSLPRSVALTGVMVDDLSGPGVTEPYRMFTSRAEWRLLLREDNADLRLSPIAENLGLLDAERNRLLRLKIDHMAEGRHFLENYKITPANSIIFEKPELIVKETVTASELLRRPAAGLELFKPLIPELEYLDSRALATLETEIKFAGYIKRQEEEVARLRKEEELPIPASFNFMSLNGLTAEVKEALTKHRPATLGQARRLSGITPAALTVLAIHLKAKP